MDDSIYSSLKTTLRIHSIEMTNFRNIVHSKIVFPNSSLGDLQKCLPSVLGIYGQNGSGKTSVVMALGLLKQLVSGRTANRDVNRRYLSCIRKGCDRATLTFEFSLLNRIHSNRDFSETEKEVLSLSTDAAKYEITYSFDIIFAETFDDKSENRIKVIQFENEQLSIKIIGVDGVIVTPKQVFIDTSESVCTGKMQSFGSKSKFRMITHSDTELQTELFKIKAIAKSQSRSFIFSDDFIEKIWIKYIESRESKLIDLYRKVFWMFIEFGTAENESEFQEIYQQKVRQLLAENSELDGFNYDQKSIYEADADELDNAFGQYGRALVNNINATFGTTSDFDSLIDSEEEFDKLLTDLESNSHYREQVLTQSLIEVLVAIFTDIKSNLFVIDTINMGIVTVNKRLPLVIRIETTNDITGEREFSYRTLSLKMDEETRIDSKDYDAVAESISKLSLVVSRIIPELTLTINNLGARYVEDKELNSIEILAIRDGVTIPLKYESDGIRRLISILSPLIGVYNDPSIILAVDEIDSGIFEYLLGEIFQVFSDYSKGQLIFTSHNLRPLEVLPARFLVFTTANAQNRYTALEKRGNTNLRDKYFRSITLGTDGDEIYRSTDTNDIADAFEFAGN